MLRAILTVAGCALAGYGLGNLQASLAIGGYVERFCRVANDVG